MNTSGQRPKTQEGNRNRSFKKTNFGNMGVRNSVNNG